jgi:hypothetical protein
MALTCILSFSLSFFFLLQCGEEGDLAAGLYLRFS